MTKSLFFFFLLRKSRDGFWRIRTRKKFLVILLNVNVRNTGLQFRGTVDLYFRDVFVRRFWFLFSWSLKRVFSRDDNERKGEISACLSSLTSLFWPINPLGCLGSIVQETISILYSSSRYSTDFTIGGRNLNVSVIFLFNDKMTVTKSRHYSKSQ